MDGNLALDALLQRDERFSCHHARNLLQLTVQQIHQLLVVAGVELHHHGVGTRGEMALHHLGDMLQALHHLLVHRAALQVDAHIGAGAIAQGLGVDIEAAAGDDVALDEALHTLVDGGTRHTTLGGHIFKRDTCILRENVQDFLVEVINFFHLLLKCLSICQQK